MVWLPDSGKNFEDMYNHIDRIPVCDRQTDRQTSCQGIVRELERRAVKMVQDRAIVRPTMAAQYEV